MLNLFLKTYFLLVLLLVAVSMFFVARVKRISAMRFITVFLIVIILPAIVGYFVSIYVATLPEVTIPDMRGKALNEAEVLLSQSRLRSHFSGSVYDDQITTGLVVSQRPEAGRVVKVGRIVNLFTSSGRRQVQVPNLLGRPYDQAAEVLVNTGLNVGSVSFDYVADMDSGLVLSQDPLPGASTEAGALINLAVSTSEAVVEPAAQEPAEVPKQDKKGGFWPW